MYPKYTQTTKLIANVHPVYTIYNSKCTPRIYNICLKVNSKMYPQYTQYIIANVPQEYTIYDSELIAKCTSSIHNI